LKEELLGSDVLPDLSNLLTPFRFGGQFVPGKRKKQALEARRISEPGSDEKLLQVARPSLSLSLSAE